MASGSRSDMNGMAPGRAYGVDGPRVSESQGARLGHIHISKFGRNPKTVSYDIIQCNLQCQLHRNLSYKTVFVFRLNFDTRIRPSLAPYVHRGHKAIDERF